MQIEKVWKKARIFLTLNMDIYPGAFGVQTNKMFFFHLITWFEIVYFYFEGVMES